MVSASAMGKGLTANDCRSHNGRGSETYALQTMAVGTDFKVHDIRRFRRRSLADTAKVSVHRTQDADVLALGPDAWGGRGHHP